MATTDPIQSLAQSVQSIFMEARREFNAADFVAMADALGFTVHPPRHLEDSPLPIAANHIPDLIGVNLEHALTTYLWGSLRPLSDDGVTVSGVWQGDHSGEAPSGYVLSEDGRWWRKAI